MKRLLFIAGFISAFCYAFSMMARLWRWEDGIVITSLMSSFGLLLLVLPLVGIKVFGRWGSIPKVIIALILLSGVAGIFIACGTILRALHHPIGYGLVNLGVLVFILLFLPALFISGYNGKLISSPKNS